MSRKYKGTFAIILVVAILINAGIFAKMTDNKNHISEDTIVIRIGHTVAEDNPIHQGLLSFKKELEEISNGRFEVRIYPNASLGGDRQELESTILGYLQGCIPPSGVLSGFDPRFMVIDLPFVFKSGKAAVTTLNGDLGRELRPILEDLGLHSVGWTETGFRHVTTNDIKVTSPDKLKGLSIRTMENPIHVASFRAWGASPTPMAFSELFTALQQGAVDAQENPVSVTVANRLFEVQNTLSLTGHFYSAGAFSVNRDFYKMLKGQDKAWFDEAGEHFVKYLTELTWKEEASFIKQAKDEGMEVVELTPEQKDVFVKKAENVYDLYIEKYGGSQELIDKAMMYNDKFN